MRKYLIGVIALLALAFTSLGLALSSPSGAASPGTSTASGRCSKATALKVATPLNLVDTLLPNPIAGVLCGAFTGPGSQAMVATFAQGTCLPNSGWAVFRFTGGAWQLVPNGYHGGFVATLVAVGSDIRETVPIWRKSDGPCNPTGGTKARIWHWNGTRLVAGPWKLTLAKLHLDNFLSPDRKVWCRIFKDAVEDDAWCVTMTDPEHSGTVKRNGEVTICNGYCTQNWDRGAPVLRYGQQTELYGYRCTSETKGITCTVIAPGKGHGKGFLINRDGVSRVGP